MRNVLAEVAIFGVAVVLAPSAALTVESTASCSGCVDCSASLAAGLHDTVVLDRDILDHEGTCIDLSHGESNVVFDCGGHLIDGEETDVEPFRGFWMMHGSGNTVRNCRIQDFDSGIFLVEASGATIVDNVFLSNRIGIELTHADSNVVSRNTVAGSSTGIKISNSDNNTFEANSVCDNFPWDFYLANGTGNVGLDNTCDSTWYWNDVGTSDCDLICTIFECGFESGGFDLWSVVSK